MTAPRTADEIHFPLTDDGWHLALHRYRPRGDGSGSPLILCAGYACNRHFLDYDDRYSLARFLARAGFDAWVLELRGRGMSYPEPGRGASWSWTFDDLASRDVPRAIDHVAEVTGLAVTWVGHSMGGMLLYAYCGQVAPEVGAVRGGVTIATPVVFPMTASRLLSEIGMFLLRVPFSETIHQRWALGALWTVLGSSSVLAVGMNPDNVDRPTVGRALRLSLENVPRAKLQQLATWAHEGVFASVDGRIDYRARLSRIDVPLLAIAGAADRLAPPEGVALALEGMAPSRVQFLELSRARGFTADYGHVDLILGRNAPDEVFSRIASWITEVLDGSGTQGKGRAHGSTTTTL